MTTYQVTAFGIGENTGVMNIGNTLNFKSWSEARSYISRTTNHNCYQTNTNEWRTPWLPKCVDGKERICSMYRIDELEQ